MTFHTDKENKLGKIVDILVKDIQYTKVLSQSLKNAYFFVHPNSGS